MFNIKGTLKKIYPTQQVSDKFKKREFVLTEDSNPQYPQYISFQLVQDKCDLLDTFREGQSIEVSFSLRGREWNNPKTGETKYFNSLDAFRITALQGSGEVPPPADDFGAGMDDFDLNSGGGSGDDVDDLPF